MQDIRAISLLGRLAAEGMFEPVKLKGRKLLHWDWLFEADLYIEDTSIIVRTVRLNHFAKFPPLKETVTGLLTVESEEFCRSDLSGKFICRKDDAAIAGTILGWHKNWYFAIPFADMKTGINERSFLDIVPDPEASTEQEPVFRYKPPVAVDRRTMLTLQL